MPCFKRQADVRFSLRDGVSHSSSASRGRRSGRSSPTRELRKLQLAFVGSITGEWGFLVALAGLRGRPRRRRRRSASCSSALGRGGADRVVARVLRRPLPARARDARGRSDARRRMAVMAAGRVLRLGVRCDHLRARRASSRSRRRRSARRRPRCCRPWRARPRSSRRRTSRSTAIESVGAFVGPALGGLLLAATSAGSGLRGRPRDARLVGVPRLADPRAARPEPPRPERSRGHVLARRSPASARSAPSATRA